MAISTPLACLNLGPKQVQEEIQAMYEENSIFDYQAEEISKHK